MDNVFISSCGTKYICTLNGVPCFTRTTHDNIIKQRGFERSEMENLTFSFYYTGKGVSIKDFLNY